jgi:hypothetical protein
MERDNLTAKQKDYAVFLPALSGFYATYVGKQRHDPTYVDPARIPADFENGIEGLNWLNPDAAYFPYHWALYSAGHAELDVNKHSPKEDMIRNRDRSRSFVLGDSGGFQIGKGVWEGDWKNPTCPKAQKKRELVLRWMDAYMDYGMILDIPAWVCRSPAGREATGITTYMEAVEGTYINNDYFMKNRTGACKFLNVLQGENHGEAEDWYQRMKKYCDPRQYERPFNGWAMGGQNMCDVHLILKRLVALRFDGLLEEGLHDWMHFLGTSKLEWACLLTDIQRAVRKYHNPNFTVSFDCASPFLASANGQIYIQTEIENKSKWTYRMVPSVDDKKYATDTRRFRDAVLQDNLFKAFTESPISQRCTIKDICIYKDGIRKTQAELGEGVKFDVTNLDHYISPPDLNKINKVGKTSWDSFSYAIQMGHNVWSHLTAVQTANQEYDLGIMPAMMHSETADKKTPRNYGTNTFREIVDLIFAVDNREDALALIEYYSAYFQDIRGTRGATGDKAVNAGTMFNSLFESEEPEEHHVDDSGLDEASLDNLENELGE